MLLAAAVWLDLVWPVFVLLGIEQVRIDPGNTAFTPLEFASYPWTHSALLALAWSVAFALVAKGFGLRLRDRTVLGALVFSHWLLDAIVHRPDLPLAPGGHMRIGLGLWNSIAGTLAVEGLMMAAGLWLYLRTTRARDAVGLYAFWGLVVFYIVIWLANLVAPPPPSAQAIGWVGVAGWLLPVWAGWADRHRALHETVAAHPGAATMTP